MALRRRHKRMKMVGGRAVQRAGNERSVLSWGQAPALHSPLPTPLDSGPVSRYGACF